MALDEEVELKFLADAKTWQSLQSAPPFAGLGRAAEQFLRTRYFDTPDHKLHEKGIYFRLRQTDGEMRQSIKQTGDVARAEWENELSEPRPNFDVLAERQVAPVLKNKATLDSLQPIFRTDVRRLSLLWEGGGARIEISFDKGEIKTNGHELDLHEVELELKEGAVAELFALAQLLVAAAPMTLSFVSKGERGFLLSAGKWGQPQKVAVPNLSRGMGAGDAFTRICRACLHTFMLNSSLFEPATQDPAKQDIEIVHQSRVALRRLRAAMSFFAPIAEGQRYETLRHELKWMSDLLGAARDLDVWQTSVFRPRAAETGTHPGFAFLSHSMEGLRQKAYARLADALISARWRKTLLEFAIFLQIEDWTLGDRATPLDDFLDDRLSKRVRKLVKEGKNLRELDSDAQHHLRIRAKKLRYTAEFFESLADGSKDEKNFKRLAGACEDMQAALGEIHDRIALKAFLAEEFTKVDARSGAQNVPAAFAAGLLAQEQPDHGGLLRDAEKAYRELKEWRRFWR